ncbi:MAG: amidohydrolase family protein, partial [Acidimicrobiia bacterium]|nr:amidohydrolase family protein [Acidimicrobiia bacterium]
SFFGTNWPVDRMYSSYSEVVTAYRQIIADFSHDEQEAMFSRNAERVYRI